MTTDRYTQIKRSRRTIWIGIVVATVTATAITALRIVNSDIGGAGETLGSLALGAAAALPAGFAWLSLDRRPGLLPAAAFGIILVGMLSIVLLPPALIAALLWFRASRSTRSKDASRWAGLRRIGLAVMVLASVMILFVHSDPACRETLADGSVRSVDPVERGLDSGWSFGVGSSTSSSSSGSAEVVASVCSSDTIVVGEAVASLLISATTLGLAGRWPVNQRGDTTPSGSGGADRHAELS